ncbi:lipopolysaccharide biosynthesis protein [Alkalibacterium olivapovliticus]|uniref:O-antigen/teichoic acid export membrane protein n=1 Tax=Alkalibacterium olivapovliticus TaxID=99907 RepID=A0A2T0W6Z3_9LACT|nr:lipopolysaccharide biosynthesis protein [Alkalibacterium olivapovliticus]PRY82466.1 O-antigen/teichoic acid export membrane protein [Alkalibacterium olivapovliticus]
MKKVDSSKETTLRKMVWSFMDTFGSKGIYLIIQLILARILTPSDFGVIGIVSIFIVLSTVLYDSGFANALLREKESTQSDYSTVFLYNLMVSTSLYFILVISSGIISRYFDTPQMGNIIRVLGIVLIIDSVGFVQRIQLTKKLEFNLLMKINISCPIISGVVGIALALNGFGIWSLVFKLLMTQALLALLYTITNRWKPSLVFSKTSFKRLFNFGWKLLAAKLISQFYENLYALIIGSGFSMSTLGFYTEAQKLSTSASYSIESSVEQVSYPVLSKFQDDEPRLKDAFQKTFRNTVFIIFPVMLVLAAIAPAMFRLLLGDNWLPAIPYFQIMCFAGIFTPLHSLNLNILQVKGRSDLYLRKSIIGNLIATIVVGSVLIFNLGIYGLLWGLVVDYFISYFNNASHTKLLIGYSIVDQLKDIRIVFAISLFTAVVAYSFNTMNFINDFILISTQLMTSAFIYLALSYVFKIKELSTVYLLTQPIQKKIWLKRI